ncbi:hypothetical protein ACLOJK_005090 [Asimina triloba]
MNKPQPLTTPSVKHIPFAYGMAAAADKLAAAISIVVFLISILGYWVYRWRNPRCNGRLPPGSMGFPLLGETLQFIAPHTDAGVSPFLKERIKRYGPVFKTSLFGLRVVASAEPEFSYSILQQEGSFASWYPESLAKIFGEKTLPYVPAPTYKYAKSLLWKMFGLESLRETLVPEFEEFACRFLQKWSQTPSIEVHDAVSDMVFDLTAKKLISYDPAKWSWNFRKTFDELMKGVSSFPLDIPGTTYSQCLKIRKKTVKMLEKMMEERIGCPEVKHGDFLDILINERKNEKTLITHELAVDLIFGLLFAAFDPTCSTLTLTIKLISENPEVLEALQEEHKKILKKKEDPSSGLTWEDCKSMKLTAMVITEATRLSNFAGMIFRKASHDYTTKEGYTIPAGWAVMVCPPVSHFNPEVYKDPLTFNPWRWEKGTVDITGRSKDYLAFGSGLRHCAGADFSKTQMSVFLHHLLMNYRWTVIEGGTVGWRPEIYFPNGFHIRLEKKSKEEQVKTN